MKYRFADRHINSLTDLLGLLAEDEDSLKATAPPGQQARRHKVWFRGLVDARYELVPSFHREPYRIDDEVYMMNLFRQNAHEFVHRIPTSEWEWMFLMRHHGVPSRLLDWSESPLIGLFFSVDSQATKKTNGALWCLLPGLLNGLALRWPEQADTLPMFTEKEEEYTLGENEALQNYLPSRLRRPRPAKVAIPPAAGISVRTTRRIQAQFGVFTVHHANDAPLESIGDKTHVWRFIIPAARKAEIVEDLRRIGVTRRTVFPELDNVAADVCHEIRGF